MENKQTAVMWLIEQIKKIDSNGYSLQMSKLDEFGQQAKAMEREQIEDAYNQDLYGGLSGYRKYENGSDYFTKNYQNGK